MKNINKNELIELIKSIPSRSYTEKPILIYQVGHSGPEMFLELLWHKQYTCSYVSVPSTPNKEWYLSDQCKFFMGCLLHYDQEFIDWCLQWQKEYKKPVVILLEKVWEYTDKYSVDSLFGLGGAKLKKLPEVVGAETYSFAEDNFELYDYAVNEALRGHLPMGTLEGLNDDEIQMLAQKFEIK